MSAATLRSDPIGEYAGGAIVILAPAALGRLVRRERDGRRSLEELAWHLERERERSAHAAVAEGRARIARELHDVVSHGVGAITVQSEAAPSRTRARPATRSRTARGHPDLGQGGDG